MICMLSLIGEWIKVPVSKRDCFQENNFFKWHDPNSLQKVWMAKLSLCMSNDFTALSLKALFSYGQEKETFPALEHNIY